MTLIFFFKNVFLCSSFNTYLERTNSKLELPDESSIDKICEVKKATLTIQLQ